MNPAGRTGPLLAYHDARFLQSEDARPVRIR